MKIFYEQVGGVVGIGKVWEGEVSTLPPSEQDVLRNLVQPLRTETVSAEKKPHYNIPQVHIVIEDPPLHLDVRFAIGKIPAQWKPLTDYLAKRAP